MNRWAVGLYTMTLRVSRPHLPAWTTNGVPIALAPLITVNPLDAAPGDIDLTVTCTPRLLPEQSPHTQLIFGSQSLLPAAISSPADPLQPTALTFIVPAVVAGEYVVRLRVGGIDSLPVTITGSPAKLDFDPQQKAKVA